MFLRNGASHMMYSALIELQAAPVSRLPCRPGGTTIGGPSSDPCHPPPRRCAESPCYLLPCMHCTLLLLKDTSSMLRPVSCLHLQRIAVVLPQRTLYDAAP